MNSYLQQIQMRGGNNLEEYNVGGLPITSIDHNLYSNTHVQGGNMIDEGITKIQHLSIPLGLVLIPPLCKMNCPKIHKNTESDFLEERLFDNLWRTVLKKSNIDLKIPLHTKNTLKNNILLKKKRKNTKKTK
jgi:hypothetical protein